MGAEAFTKARTYLTAHSVEALDFPKFLELYAAYSGLTAASYSKISAKEGVVPYWVPSNHGLWIEVRACLCMMGVFSVRLSFLTG